MGETTRSLILTVLPYTASSFRRRNAHFVPIYMKPATTAATTYLDFYCLPSAVKPADFGSSGCFALRRKSSPVRAFGQSQQMGGNGSKGTKGFSWAQPILRFAGNNILPLVLVIGVALGLAYPSLGCAADKYNLSKLGPFGIFVISGLMLRGEEISAAVEAWPVGLFGLVSILFLTPYFSRIIMQIQLQPQEFITAKWGWVEKGYGRATLENRTFLAILRYSLAIPLRSNGGELDGDIGIERSYEITLDPSYLDYNLLRILVFNSYYGVFKL